MEIKIKLRQNPEMTVKVTSKKFELGINQHFKAKSLEEGSRSKEYRITGILTGSVERQNKTYIVEVV